MTTINGQPRSFEGDPKMPLLWCLRDIAGMTGTSLGAARHRNRQAYPRVAHSQSIRTQTLTAYRRSP